MRIPLIRFLATLRLCATLAFLAGGGEALAEVAPKGETVDQALCRMIDKAATDNGLRREFLTRLIWRESRFDTNAVSPKGAQGVAQFMPGTASDRGLQDPFDPEAAIPASAHLLADHLRDFGNIGLAAAAYNAGPDRVRRWMAGTTYLPSETQAYVQAITGYEAEDWAALNRGEATEIKLPTGPDDQSCHTIVVNVRKRASPAYARLNLSPLAPWGVQLAGGFSRSVALRSYSRESRRYARVLGGVRPMIIGTRLRSRGTRTFYRVRAPAATRVEAERLCGRIRSAGGSCAVLKS